MTTYLDFIRHGTPEGGNRYRGHSIDDPLSETGWQQMWAAVEQCSGWQQVVSSPMQRCHAFAQAYAGKHHLPLSTDERLKEIGFGDWEGKTSKQIQALDAQLIRNFYHDPVTHQPDNAEPLDHFQHRVSAAIDDMLQTYQNQNVLVVAHAGVIRAAITHTLKTSPSSMYRISIGNAAIIQIKDDGIRPPTVML